MPSFIQKYLLPSDKISVKDRRRGLNLVLCDGIVSQNMESLGAGVFLVAFALQLGASSTVIGVLTALPFLGNAFQPLVALLVEKLRVRKIFTVILAALNRPMFLLAGSMVFFQGWWAAPYVLVLAFCGRYGMGCASSCSWNSWMRDFVPRRILGRFFARRLKLMMGAAIACTLIGGALIDLWKTYASETQIYSFGILQVLAFMSGVYSVYSLIRTPEPRMERRGEEDQGSVLKKIKDPFKDKNFSRLMIFLGLWNFALNLSAPFFTVHMLTRLHLNVSSVVAFTILSQVSSMLVISIWGKIADKFSYKSVLSISVPIYLGCIFLWILTAMPEEHTLTIPLLVVIHIFAGCATAGVTLATGNIALKLTPKGSASIYLASNNLVNAFSAGIAPIIGGALSDFLAKRELALLVTWKSEATSLTIKTFWMSHWDFLFMFSVVLGLIALTRLSKVRERGEVQEKVAFFAFIDETKRTFSFLSSVLGFRIFSGFRKGDEESLVPPIVSPPDPEVETVSPAVTVSSALDSGSETGEVFPSPPLPKIIDDPPQE